MEEWRAVSRVLKSPVRMVRAAYDDLVTTFFPADCRACGGPLLRADSTSVCNACIDALRPQTVELCVRCGEALDVDGLNYRRQFGADALQCAPCRMAPPEFERTAAWGLYEDEMRELIHLLKYEGIRSAAEPLGKLLARVMESVVGEGGSGEFVVIAVPLYPAKQRQRGYNQSVLLADVAMRAVKRSRRDWMLLAAHGAIQRVRDTESPFGLSESGRRRNLRGAFEVIDPAAIAGKEVLLVDDIYTTGATARECAWVLRRAGAEKVWVATVARTQREMVAMWNDNAAEIAVWAHDDLQ